jgi:hypothetical protein
MTGLSLSDRACFRWDTSSPLRGSSSRTQIPIHRLRKHRLTSSISSIWTSTRSFYPGRDVVIYGYLPSDSIAGPTTTVKSRGRFFLWPDVSLKPRYHFIQVSWFDSQFERQANAKLDRIIAMLAAIEGEQKEMEKSVQDLIDQATKNESVEASALVVINGIAARINAAGNDPAKLAALVSDLKASGQALSDAVAANTPAAA